MSTFYNYIDRVLATEGGFTDDKRDPGNWTGGSVGVGELRGTKFGISAASYPNVDIKSICRESAVEIYRTDFWNRINGDKLPKALAFSVLDGAVNSGVKRSIQWIQQAAGVADDGLFGPITASAVASADGNDLLLKYNAARLKFMTRLSTWSTYGKGWATRIANNLVFGSEDN